MPSLVLIVREILLLRRGPQDLPYSPSALIVVALLGVIVQTCATLSFVETTFDNAFVAAIVEMGLNLIALRFMLGVRRRQNRFVQAAMALLLCDLVFTSIGLGFAALIKMAEVMPDQLTPLQKLLQLMLIPFVIWQIVVDGHILRRSLDIPTWVGVVLAVLLTAAITAASTVGGAP
jgi:hypothetical protein